MSIDVSHIAGAVVVTAKPVGDEDCLDVLDHVLEDLVQLGCRVVLDLSNISMSPASRVTAFMERLGRLLDPTGPGIVVVVELTTERWLLRTLSPDPGIPVFSSVPAALGPEPELAD